MNTLARISAQNKLSLQEGLKIVRKVVATNPNPAGFTTAELYKLAVKEPALSNFQYEVLPLRRATDGKGGKQRIPGPVPPRPDHPIRSMTFLKNAVLPILEGNKELQIVRTTRVPFNPAPSQRTGGKRKNKPETTNAASAAAPAPVTTWVWKTVDKSNILPPPVPKMPPKVFGTEVGVEEDWSHLNKRRQRARTGKVARDVTAMKLAIIKRKIEGKRIYERNMAIHQKKLVQVLGQATAKTKSNANAVLPAAAKSPTVALS
ncbi:hypothetical protein BDZ94DRAFT_1267532 [Collybia nuda]|uniref:Uncharacterized protein n=1 Tax=Collybia nuda TaxID=64659 RepID=A0A9P6CF04_9AGAR|nr:hypothetical protein BDZ94DRAFT_1267532 [Collybia nuda]